MVPSSYPIETRRDAVRLARAIVALAVPPALLEAAALSLASYVLEEERAAAHLLGDLVRLASAAPPPPFVAPPSCDERPTQPEVPDPSSVPPANGARS